MGATAQTHTLVAVDLNAMISFEVTPVAQSGTSPGVPVTSPEVGPVAPAGGGTGGSVVHEQTVTGGLSSSNTVATSAALTGVTGHLYLAAISTRPNVAVSAVSGLGLTWTQVATQCSGRNATRATVFRAQGTPSGDGVVTATFSSTATNAVISVSRYSGASPTDPIDNVIAGNTRGLSGACSGGTDSGTYSFNLTTTVGGAVVYGAAALRNRTHTAGAGYTERSDLRQGSNGDVAGIASEDRSVATAGTVTVAGTFSKAVDWAVIGVGIKPGGTPPPNTAPTASNVAISGTPEVGQLFSGSYTYADPEGDPEGASTFRWLRDGTPIAGATAQSYVLVAADQGTMVSFEVTPVAQSGTSPGLAVTSAAVGPVAPALNDPPVASNVLITGTYEVGQTLTGEYTYADPEGDPEGASTFRWLRDGTPIAGATALTYDLVAADEGAMISFEVTPVAQSGTSPGIALVSAAVGPVTP